MTFRRLGWAPGSWGTIALLSLVLCPMARADSQSEALNLLQRVYAASQKLSYSGTFVYQHGQHAETSRITRLIEGGITREKLETMDGVPREIVREGDDVVCYLPSLSTVRIDKQAGQRSFPGLLPGHFKELTENYVLRRGEPERVAGYDCQVLLLEPRDNMRYAHRLWIEPRSGMIVKSRTYNERNEVMEQFAFTQLRVGGGIERESLRSSFTGKTSGWRVEDAAASEANLAEAGWTLKSRPPGFKKIVEMRRNLGGASGVGHMVLSDGLVAISVFIEAATNRPVQQELSRQGAINVYVRQMGNHRITVLGEAPAASVKYIANAVEFRPQ
jgi:sigma-E factor negative regulatory protein RseB